MKRAILICIFYFISIFKPSHQMSLESVLEIRRSEMVKNVTIAGYPSIQDDIAVANYYGNTYVAFKTLTLNWMEANIKCKRHGMKLPTFKSKEEFEFLEEFITKNIVVSPEMPTEAWIGATDLFTEGHFTWIDSGKPFSAFYNTPAGADNWQGNEHCLHFDKNAGDTKYTINDTICARKYGVVCKFTSDHHTY